MPTVNIGNAANDGQGDALRSAFGKINTKVDTIDASVDALGANGMTRLVNVGGSWDQITADLPTGASAYGAAGTGRYVILVPAGANVEPSPTLQIGGGFTRTLRTGSNGTLGAGMLVPGAMHVIHLASNNVARVHAVFPIATDLPTIRSTLAAMDVAVNTLSSSLATIAARPALEYALQVNNSLPARPNSPVVHWLTWSDPTAFMAAADLWFQMPEPTVPDMPPDASWRWSNARTGNSGVLQILALPVANPPLTSIQYRLDGGNWVTIPAVVGDVPVGGLTLGQTYGIEIRYVNFVGAGVPTAAQQITINSTAFFDDFNRADQNLSIDARWLDVRIGNNGRRAAIRNNAVQGVASNETFAVQVQDYFAPDQYVEAHILGTGTNTSDGRGAMLFVRMQPGQYSGYQLRLFSGFWRLSKIENGVSTTMVSGSYPGTYPAQARLEITGNDLYVYIGGAAAGGASDLGDSPFTRGTVGLAMQAAGADGANAIRIDNFTAGNM